MWLYRGAQSAVFYYATCTPCAGAIDRRKRKKEAVRSRRQKAKAAALITDQPRPFAQPTPFSTNEGWKEEITLGPGPPVRRGGHRPNNHRSGSWKVGEEPPALSSESTRSLGHESPQRKEKGVLGERWNWMRYQREDEPLWGEELQGSSVGISGRGRADTGASGKYYYTARAPPVNDLHPPIVSGPTSRAETRWMLQPPPSAKVMAGKERSNVSVRGSRGGSRDESLRKRDVYVRPPGEIGEDEEEDEDEDDVQFGQSKPLDERSSWLHNRSATSRKSLEKNHRPPPVKVSNNYCSTTDSTSGDVKLPRRPPLAAAASHTGVIYHGRKTPESCWNPSSSIHSISSSPSLLSSLADSLEGSPPYLHWRCPETPSSRPASKATDDSGKAFSPLPQDCKDIQSVHLKINEEHNILQEPDQLKEVRPWRWSMDI